MSMNIRTIIIKVIWTSLLIGTGQAAEQPGGVENKLRETLRGTMQQLRDVQTQLSTLQGTQSELEDKNKSLDEKLKLANQKADKDKLESEKAIEGLRAAVDAKDAEIAQLKDVVEKAKLAIEQKEKLQASTEEKRKQLEERAIALDRRVADQQMKNAAMYKLGLEVIGRYEKFGLGDAISAREPFIGATRVRFENLVQDYQDKLTEQKIKPAPGSARDASQTASQAKGTKAKARESSKRNENETEKGVRPRD